MAEDLERILSITSRDMGRTLGLYDEWAEVEIASVTLPFEEDDVDYHNNFMLALRELVDKYQVWAEELLYK